MAAANLPAAYEADLVRQSIDYRFKGNQMLLQQNHDEVATFIFQCAEHVKEAKEQIDDILRPKIHEADEEAQQHNQR